MMKPLHEFTKTKLSYVFTDIDDTLTDEGQLHAHAYDALWKLSQSGIHVVPVTGRPAGWCEMIARMWPVSGVIGENGGFYFRYHNKHMKRHFAGPAQKYQAQLEKIRDDVLVNVPGTAVASDQFCRLMDLAIDFCEDVPALPSNQVRKIVEIFHKHGAVAKVSSIHVNGWFGSYNKLSMCQEFLKNEFATTWEQSKHIATFVGDSPNDEPMFEAFPLSFGVANIASFAAQLKFKPTFVASARGGHGFVEIAEKIMG